MLLKLLSASDRSSFQHVVVSLTSGGPLATEIGALGVRVESLDMTPGIPSLRALSSLRSIMRKERPHVLQSWMYHADLLAGLASIGYPRIPVVWGIHHSTLDVAATKPLTRLTQRACALSSRFMPSRIVCCSESARAAHVMAGYSPSKMLVIPNGFDLGRFHRDTAARAAFRASLEIPQSAHLVGVVARWDPNKDHRSFVAAATEVANRLPTATFALCGDGITWDNAPLSSMIDATRQRGRFILLGARSDMPQLMASLDVLCLSSTSEGFPNVIGEAMAAETPCVVTDCGDCAAIVGDAGRVVAPRDPKALAGALLELLSLDVDVRRRLGVRARERIATLFSLRSVAQRYENVYREVVATDVQKTSHC